MSNAHPMGPWQVILMEANRHYSQYNAQQNYQGDIRHTGWDDVENECAKRTNNGRETLFTVLDVGSGPRDQPGTTIANTLPNKLVHVNAIVSYFGYSTSKD
jgi:hypothetical protein